MGFGHRLIDRVRDPGADAGRRKMEHEGQRPHDVHCAYWTPRPSQFDSVIRPLIGVPDHPACPSNRACLSTAAGRVLAHFFPAEAARFAQVAGDAGRSRILAAIRYRFDVEAGEAIGERVAATAIERHLEKLVRLADRRIVGVMAQ